MVRTIAVSLRPTPEQAKALLDTMEAFNAACNYVSGIAWQTGTFRHYALRKLCYYDVRTRFGLTAQLAQHAIKKVADAYKVSKATRAEFNPHGAVIYDARVLRLIGVSSVSITLLHGREKIRLSVGGYQADRIRGATLGEADLIYLTEKRRFRLHLSLRLPDPPTEEPDGFLGVDLGIKNLAADSDGTRYAGRKLRRYQTPPGEAAQERTPPRHPREPLHRQEDRAESRRHRARSRGRRPDRHPRSDNGSEGRPR